MSDELTNTVSPLEEQVVSYLDGELSPEESRRVEELLATDTAARETMQRLDRTWEMLERLDRREGGEDLTRTTLEMVAAEAEKDVAEVRAAAPQRRRRRRTAWALGGLLAAALTGFLLVGSIRPDPNRQLLEDLPVLGELDVYLEIGDIELLRQLERQEVLADYTVAGAASAAAARAMPAGDAEAARQRIEAMTPQQQEDLLRRHRQFLAMTPEDRERIRRLHRDLQEDPRSRELRETVHRYQAWLSSLPAVTRYELRDLQPPERIARIKRIVERTPREPTPEDLAGLRDWFDGYAEQLGKRFAERVPEKARERLKRLDEQERRWIVMGLILRRWHSPGQLPSFDEKDKAAIRDCLTPETRAWLESRPAAEQAGILAHWVRRAVWEKRPGRVHQPGELPPSALSERIDRFFEDLDGAEQARLLRLPPDEMQQELLALFLAESRPDRPGRRGSPFFGGRSAPGTGRPPGPGGRSSTPSHGPFRAPADRGPWGGGHRPPPDGPAPQSTPEKPLR